MQEKMTAGHKTLCLCGNRLINYEQVCHSITDEAFSEALWYLGTRKYRKFRLTFMGRLSMLRAS
jgi:hypothetical protein